jgi:hypothetical protein
MSTPKPGQIRCPTCLRSTPPAAFCTQCGSAIPESARTRPRGLDRDELEERVRRRPGDYAFRRGSSAGDAGSGGYVPFQPEPEDTLASRGEEIEARRHLDNLPLEPDVTRPVDQPVGRGWAAQPPEPEEPPAAAVVSPPPTGTEPEGMAPGRADAADIPYPPEAYEDVEYGRPEDAYVYPYEPDDSRRGGGSALPIIGFVVLCVLALAVGAVLAGLLGGEEPTGQASPTPTAAVSQAPSEAPSLEPSTAPSESAPEATPDPNDGPVTFPDGAVLSIQPCGSGDYNEDAVGRPEEDACQVDGSTVSDGEVWAFVVFNGADGDDTIRVRLMLNGQVENEQELTIRAVVGCGSDCNGLIYGAHYVDLLAGDYELVLHRNGEFADSATFTVEG